MGLAAAEIGYLSEAIVNQVDIAKSQSVLTGKCAVVLQGQGQQVCYSL